MRSALTVTVVSFVAGLLLGRVGGAATALREAGVPDSQRESSRAIYRSLSVRQLDVVSRESSPVIRWGLSAEGSPGVWISSATSAAIQAGVHQNGFPFLLVSDGAIRSFGLGRVDGTNASPILVFRSNDIVRMVFGLSMTERGQPPFLVHYSADGTKTDFFGHYCDDLSRVCAR